MKGAVPYQKLVTAEVIVLRILFYFVINILLYQLFGVECPFEIRNILSTINQNVGISYSSTYLARKYLGPIKI